MRIALAFVDSRTILSAFILRLTGSNTLVGLAGSIMPAGWMWPQLLMSNILESRQRKMPFYTLGMSIRVFAWVAIILCTLWIGDNNHMLLAVYMLSFCFVGASAMGVSTLPYMDIVSKAIEPQRRARFFSIRQFIGGGFSFLIGFFISYVLGNESGMPFPRNYALLFACSVVGNIGSLIAFLCVHEPIRPVQKKRKSFWQHVEQGPRLLKTDVNYRRFLFFRVFMGISEMAMPFYVPYALLRFGVPESIIGSFVVVLALSEVISNALWGYIGEKYGVRFILIGASALGCLSPLIAISVQFLPPPWRAPSYFLIFAVNGVAGNGVMVGFMTYMLNLAPPKIRPTYLGFLNTLLFPFSFLPVLAGKLVKGFAVNALFFSVPIPGIDYEGVFVVSLIAGMCAFLMSRQLKDVYHPEDMYGQENSLEKRD